MTGTDKKNGETQDRKPLLDPTAPRVDVAQTGGGIAGGRHIGGPELVRPGAATTGSETTRAQ